MCDIIGLIEERKVFVFKVYMNVSLDLKSSLEDK